ncbi:hypothetical protein [Shouchella patagoniensis]|uniref:hypothetical protein n=1 Tax=Shouchella patagoniensis TaxID=228576 RepID=UPI000995AD24|nr:hypothetical protein [Shouchella patagoniensis]
MKNYFKELKSLKTQVEQDFDYFNERQSMIDKRIQELKQRPHIDENAVELEMLLKTRREVKERVLQLLPVRDMFKHEWAAVESRVEKVKQNSARIQDEIRKARQREKELV